MFWGDLLALGAICFGLYSVAGRSQRNRYSLFAYAGSVYALAALWLLPAADQLDARRLYRPGHCQHPRPGPVAARPGPHALQRALRRHAPRRT